MCRPLCSGWRDTNIRGGTENWTERFTFQFSSRKVTVIVCLFLLSSWTARGGDRSELLISNLNLRQKGLFLVPTVGQTVKSLLSPSFNITASYGCSQGFRQISWIKKMIKYFHYLDLTAVQHSGNLKAENLHKFISAHNRGHYLQCIHNVRGDGAGIVRAYYSHNAISVFCL